MKQRTINFVFALQLTIVTIVLLSLLKFVIPTFYGNLLGNAIIRGFVFALITSLTIRQFNLQKEDLFPRREIKKDQVAFTGIVILPLFFLTWIMTELEVLLREGSTDYIAKSKEIFSLGPNAKFFITTLLVGPIVEELFFRGLLLTSLRNTYNNDQKANIYSSLVFGLAHVRADNTFFSSIASSFLMGLLFGLVFLQTQNIRFVIILHFAWNLLVYVFPIAMFHTGFKIRDLGDFVNLFTILSVLVIGGFVWAYSFYKNKSLGSV